MLWALALPKATSDFELLTLQAFVPGPAELVDLQFRRARRRERRPRGGSSIPRLIIDMAVMKAELGGEGDEY